MNRLAEGIFVAPPAPEAPMSNVVPLLRRPRRRAVEPGAAVDSAPRAEAQLAKAVVEELVRRHYTPHALPELLGALMRALAEHTGATAGQLWLPESGTLVLGRNGSALTVDWLNHASEIELGGGHAQSANQPIDEAVRAAEWQEQHGYREPPLGAPGDAQAPLSLKVPVPYRHAADGELRLTAPAGAGGEEQLTATMREFGRVCALFERRHFVQRWTQKHLGQPLVLIGVNPAVRAIDDFVDKAASANIPVLITGEFGTEKTLTAVALHCCGSRRRGRFVEVHCAAQSATDAISNLPHAIEQSRDGTLFLNGIDELPMPAQKQILQQLQSSLGQWVGSGDQSRQPRLIASVTGNVHQLAEEGRFSKALLAEIDFLSITLPPLRDRSDDIEFHLTFLLEKYGWRAKDKRTPALVTACQSYDWPDNLIEMERIIARLAVMTGTRAIERGDIQQHAPRLHGLDAERGGVPRVPPASLNSPEQWARHLASGTVPESEMKKLHEGLQRALAYLAEHAHEQMSLGQLARQARVSSSHLSFLFRSTLSTTFKVLLGRVRIERARRALAEDPRARITDVAMDSGFTDLSHFEKLFRRIVGESPREYRRRLSGD